MKKSFSDRTGRSTLHTVEEYFSRNTIPTEYIIHSKFKHPQWDIDQVSWNNDRTNFRLGPAVSHSSLEGFDQENPRREILEAEAMYSNEAALELVEYDLSELDNQLNEY
ncbi:hypothetical protein JQC92_10885 [Shewanella sp. 202IG2-18]|uniref:hypothetical protein n=1 Tax=Parashewanella hymeniacidonis TaxID=2807618 RepID=UPI00196132FA|nr:hypothetical protein [Parashewanella hymeniacidonis]MBM7072534.1 hypothetical protein [Parashewanella hymeniacidonis]